MKAGIFFAKTRVLSAARRSELRRLSRVITEVDRLGRSELRLGNAQEGLTVRYGVRGAGWQNLPKLGY
jgi:hypothetical protein